MKILNVAHPGVSLYCWCSRTGPAAGGHRGSQRRTGSACASSGSPRCPGAVTGKYKENYLKKLTMSSNHGNKEKNDE